MCYNHSSLFPIGWPSMRLYCFHHLSFWRNQLIDNTVMAGPSSVEPSQTAQAIRFSGPITPQSAEVTGPRPVLQCFPHPICHAATTLLCPYMTPDISCVWWRVYQHINSSGSPHYYTVPILDFWGPYAKLCPFLRMDEMHLSVFHSVSNHARGKRSRNSISSAARISSRFFFFK